MNLFRVTITGADDATDPEDLLTLSREFPFAEWGLLLSQTRRGTDRYPSDDWAFRLAKRSLGRGVNLSAHICGSLARDVLRGDWIYHLPCREAFARVQLNVGTAAIEAERETIVDAIGCAVDRDDAEAQVILQVSPASSQARFVLDWCLSADMDAAPLFDGSGGEGRLPAEWPAFDDRFVSIGYAGGLGPENLAAELRRIATAAGDSPFWIDMESRVRTYDGQDLDLDKVRRVLEIAAPFVTAGGARHAD